jgi:hypothetical protein
MKSSALKLMRGHERLICLTTLLQWQSTESTHEPSAEEILDDECDRVQSFSINPAWLIPTEVSLHILGWVQLIVILFENS